MALVSRVGATALPHLAEARTRRAADPHLTEEEVGALGRAETLVRNEVDAHVVGGIEVVHEFR
ncbi:hypothetical protein R6L23_21875 [Streptomyces sp. SR27]|uniref:hypothetical protein n=1 Tax=Streptomyces sp. SR27 TaxID=3076630 RepID=UPI00295BF673|nr:hypothetical protein [Streptomyces sp. SR27]MDV9190829.1 hypothetical protein [Streptomyces sp. SR27]